MTTSIRTAVLAGLLALGGVAATAEQADAQVYYRTYYPGTTYYYPSTSTWSGYSTYYTPTYSYATPTYSYYTPATTWDSSWSTVNVVPRSEAVYVGSYYVSPYIYYRDYAPRRNGWRR